MTSILEDWGKQLLEKLIKKTVEEARFLFCFTCIAKEFEEERAKLEPEREALGQRVKVAKRRNKDVPANVVSWEEEVDKLIQEDTKTKKTCFFGLCPDCIWRYKKGKKMANNMEVIKRLIEKGDKFVNVELPRPPPGVERNSSQDYISLKSRESTYNELLKALKDDNNFITGLQGMGGTGKTTLAKEVGKELKKSGQFTYVIVTTVSSTPDIKKIQDGIAGPLGLKLDDFNESDRPGELCDRLTNGDKILLILDDVWDGDPLLDFDAIGIPKLDNHKGCRVLVTTRSKQLSNKVNFDKSIELELLSDEDVWTMFKWYANISESSSNKVKNKGREIAKECKQLPLAIAIIARSLKGQQNRVEKWDAILTSLKKHVPTNGVDDDLVGIYKCLKVSYDNMKDPKAKELFLLCSLFQEDEEISIEDLTRISIGAGLFGKDYGTYDEARKKVVVSKYDLVDSIFLLKVDEKHVKMHDMVREVAQWIANKEVLGVNLSNKNQKSLLERQKNIKYLSCEINDMDLLSLKFDGSRLEVLIVIMRRSEDYLCMEVPNSFFENIDRLRVLFLSSNDKRSLSLPHSLHSLTNIRSMLVDRVDLGDISVLGMLQSLETLDLVECTINELPLEIEKLKNLRLLKLISCVIKTENPFHVIGRCSSLEELYFIDSFNDSCEEIALPMLQRYRICEGSSVLNETLSKCVSFFGEHGKVSFSNHTFKFFMQMSDGLRLDGIKRSWSNLMPEIVPIDQGMNDLVELCMRDISQLRCLIDTIGSQEPIVFSKLVVLELEGMEDLEELFNGPISFDSLNNLQEVSIEHCKHLRSLFSCDINLCNLKTIRLWNCPMLVSLFQPSIARSLVLLESLDIFNCEGLENIILDERRDEESREELDDGNKTHGLMFPKLIVLDIDGCPLLEYILPSLSAQNLPVLELIIIRRCDGLKNIIREEESREEIDEGNKIHGSMFPLLSALDIDGCPLLEYILPFHSNQDLPLLESIIINRCDGLKNILVDKRREEESREEIDEGDNDNKSRGSMLPKLEVLDIQDCPQLQYAFPFLCTQGHLVLKEISIRKCAEFKYIFHQQRSMFSYHLRIWERAQCLPPIQSYIMCNIKEINLSHFSKIKSVFILSVTSRMVLETLTITNCDDLKNIIIDTEDHDNSCFNWGNVFPKLKRINVEDCNQLEYIFTHYNHDHQNQTEIHLHLPALECLYLCNLPRLVAMCPKQYHITFPPSTLYLSECSQVDIKSFHDFTIQLISKSRDSTILKEHGYSPFGIEDLDLEDSQEITQTNNQGSLIDDTLMKVSSKIEEQFPTDDDVRVSQSIPSKGFADGTEVQATTEHELTSVDKRCRDKNGIVSSVAETKIEQTAEAKQEFVASISGLKITSVASSPTNSQELLNKQSTNQQHHIGEIDTTVKHSQEYADGQISIPSLSISTKDPLTIEDVDLGDSQKTTRINPQESKGFDNGNENPSVETTKDFDVGIKVQAASSGHEMTSLQLEGSTSEKTVAETMSTISETKNEPTTHLVSPKLKGIKTNAEKGSISTNTKTITSSTHLELELMDEESMDEQCMMTPQNSVGEIDATIKPSQGVKEVGDGKVRIPSFSIVNIEPPPTKDVDIGDSQKTIAMEDINKLIEEDPLFALEKLLIGQVSISSIRILLQELKSLMDSSSDLHHLISNQESKSKLFSLFSQLNQHQGLLPSHVKEFIEKVQTFFIEKIIKYTTFQQVLKKHNQLLDSKTDLVNKLWSAYSTQICIDHEISTANARIDELSFQTDEHRKELEDIKNQREALKSVVNRCNVQKNKLKAECTEWAQQSKELNSALASSEVDVREAERARNLAIEGFVNLKSSFPTF